MIMKNGNKKIKKFKKWMKKKGSTILAIGSFIIFGVACFVLGYGILNGWESVISWFTSDYAAIFYVGIVIWAMITIYAMYSDKVYNNGGKN